MSKVSTSEDSEISLKQVLEAIQKQNEIRKRENYRQNSTTNSNTNQTNKRRESLAKEIELLRKTVAELKLAIESQETIMTKDFEFVTNTTKKTAKSRNRDRVPVASAAETIFDLDANIKTTMNRDTRLCYQQKMAIKYIPVLNRDDDFGSEKHMARATWPAKRRPRTGRKRINPGTQ